MVQGSLEGPGGDGLERFWRRTKRKRTQRRTRTEPQSFCFCSTPKRPQCEACTSATNVVDPIQWVRLRGQLEGSSTEDKPHGSRQGPPRPGEEGAATPPEPAPQHRCRPTSWPRSGSCTAPCQPQAVGHAGGLDAARGGLCNRAVGTAPESARGSPPWRCSRSCEGRPRCFSAGAPRHQEDDAETVRRRAGKSTCTGQLTPHCAGPNWCGRAHDRKLVRQHHRRAGPAPYATTEWTGSLARDSGWRQVWPLRHA